MPEPRLVLRSWRRLAMRHRRLVVAALCAATALAFAEHVRPEPPASAVLVVAARDLPAGRVLEAADLRRVRAPRALVPDGAAGAIGALSGETLAGPVRAGEPITDRRVVGPSLVAGYPAGTVAAPMRIDDAAVAGLLEVGDRVDVYAPDPRSDDTAALLVGGATVAALPAPTTGGSSGALVVLAVDAAEAARLAQAAAAGGLSVVLRA